MKTVTAGHRLRDVIKLCYLADRQLLLVGPHGIGKSEIFAATAGEMEIDFIARDLSLMEPPDLIGIPREKNGKTVYAPPAFLPTGGSGLLVFEELNRCERYMRAPCLQLLTTRTLNDYVLPRGWLPAAAVNPDDGPYETAELDPALRSRFVEISVTADRDEWLRWARANDIHEAVISYVASGEEVSNPRGWTYVSELMKAANIADKPTPALRSAVCGTVGDAHGAAFLASLDATDSPLDVEEVLERYDDHRARVRRWREQGHVDLLVASLHHLLVHLQPEAEYERVQKSEVAWANLGLFIHDLPGDLRERAHRAFDDRGYELPAAPSHTPEGVGA